MGERRRDGPETLAQVASIRARKHAAARAQRHAAHDQARTARTAILNEKLREHSTVLDAGRAWAAAQPWPGDPEANRATSLAEDRLRTLSPDVMNRYDRLRTDGAEPVEAMTRVAPYFDRPPVRTGDPSPTRASLEHHTPDPRRQAAAAARAVAGANSAAPRQQAPARGRPRWGADAAQPRRGRP